MPKFASPPPPNVATEQKSQYDRNKTKFFFFRFSIVGCTQKWKYFAHRPVLTEKLLTNNRTGT